MNTESEILRQRAGVLFDLHHAHASGHLPADQIQAARARHPVHPHAARRSRQNPVTLDAFRPRCATARRRVGLYDERIGGVKFLSASLFRTTFSPAERAGRHPQGPRLPLSQPGFSCRKHGAAADREIRLRTDRSSASRETTLFYGFCAVGLAIITGWFGRIIVQAGLRRHTPQARRASSGDREGAVGADHMGDEAVAAEEAGKGAVEHVERPV